MALTYKLLSGLIVAGLDVRHFTFASRKDGSAEM
jgi:hypothetical protein